MATRKFKMILAFYLDTKRVREWRVLDGKSFTFTVYQSPFLADILITFTLLINTSILQSPGFVIKCTYLLNEAKLIPP